MAARQLNPTAAPGKPKADGGGSTGKRTKFKGGAETPVIKNVGKPRDKGVNR